MSQSPSTSPEPTILDTITEALASSEFIRRCIADEGLNLVNLLLRKNADYGNSALLPPVLTPNISPDQAILIRMSDKVARLTNLLSKSDQTPVNESIEDTIADLAGYAILYLAARKIKHNPKPQWEHYIRPNKPSTPDPVNYNTHSPTPTILTPEVSKNDIFQ